MRPLLSKIDCAMCRSCSCRCQLDKLFPQVRSRMIMTHPIKHTDVPTLEFLSTISLFRDPIRMQCKQWTFRIAGQTVAVPPRNKTVLAPRLNLESATMRFSDRFLQDVAIACRRVSVISGVRIKVIASPQGPATTPCVEVNDIEIIVRNTVHCSCDFCFRPKAAAVTRRHPDAAEFGLLSKEC